jgi:hypothetical protein
MDLGQHERFHLDLTENEDAVEPWSEGAYWIEIDRETEHSRSETMLDNRQAKRGQVVSNRQVKRS